jgi:carbon monoxide dehydrogenase subunit G
MTQTESATPNPTTFTTAPLRNRIRVELKAPASEVWALVGDIARLPEYSAGVERVVVERDSSGAPSEYVCHFKPMVEGGEGVVSRDLVRWHEANRGWASVGEEPNDFGLSNSLHLVTLVPVEGGTVVKWDAHYDATDLEMNRSELDKALADIAERLVKRFGGRVIERYVEGPR